MTTKWNRFLQLHEKQYHIFASYCESNDIIVREIIQFLEGLGCTVSDQERNNIPGQPLLRSLIANGIEQSKVTILFITKQFLSDEFCCFIANLAIWYYIRTRGEHRILPVILEPCKLPRYLKVFNCIHMWKYASKSKKIDKQRTSRNVYGCQIFARLTKALLDSPPKFRRIRWNGIKTLTWSKNLLQNVKRSTNKEKVDTGSTNVFNPLRILRIIQILDHCYLNCRYGHCSFACSGRDFNNFISHMRKCRYRYVKCPNNPCQAYMPKWALETHLETCQCLKTKCPFDGCGKNVAKSNLEKHIDKCQHREYFCPNNRFGCCEIITQKTSQKHIEACSFAPFNCEKCGVVILQKDQDEHTRNCKKAETICSFCKKRLVGENRYQHLDECLMWEVVCPNNGCGRTMKRFESLSHKAECLYSIVNCPHSRNGCPFMGPKSSIPKHKAYCQYKLNICHICEERVKLKDLNDHLKKCENSLTCDSCEMTVLRSEWSRHDRTCPVKHPELYSNVSDKLSTKDQDDEHRGRLQIKEASHYPNTNEERRQDKDRKSNQASPVTSPPESVIIIPFKEKIPEDFENPGHRFSCNNSPNCASSRRKFNAILNSNFDYKKLISSRPKGSKTQYFSLCTD